ncbi:MAG: hypothetical protein OHK0044_22240 [Burkholderiaceae bacterium]
MHNARILTLGLAAVFVAGCATTQLEEPKPAPVTEKATPAPAPAPAPAAPVTRTQPAPQPIDPLNDPNSPLAKREVFFDFDKFDIKPEYTGLVEAHGRYLASHKDRRVVIEGNADERGSREYNLALGQKRADAVRSRLQIVGAGAAQIETISFGEERPRCQQHNEDCWWQNRRADIKYK